MMRAQQSCAMLAIVWVLAVVVSAVQIDVSRRTAEVNNTTATTIVPPTTTTAALAKNDTVVSKIPLTNSTIAIGGDGGMGLNATHVGAENGTYFHRRLATMGDYYCGCDLTVSANV